MSSKRRIRRNKCTSKVRHASEHAARLAVRGTVAAAGGPIGFLQPYKCSFCGGWHIGHAKSARW